MPRHRSLSLFWICALVSSSGVSCAPPQAAPTAGPCSCPEASAPHARHAVAPEQTPAESAAAPQSAFDAERLSRLTRAMQAYVDDGEVSGVVALVAHRGEVAHLDVLGQRDREAGLPMQRDTIFRIYSMTKPITAVAALILYEEGKLQLTEPVDRLVPELKDMRVLKDPTGPLSRTDPSPRPITIRDLLTHTSGLAYTFTSAGPLADALRERGLTGSGSDVPPDAWVKSLSELPLMFAPGTRWHYGLSSDVLGVVIERASGMPLAEFYRTRIFEPLGMRDTGFYVPDDKMDRLAVSYRRDPESDQLQVADHPKSSSFAKPKAFSSGGGGLVSTVDDYLRFATMLLQGGELDGVRILSRKSVERMTSNALRPQEMVDAPFGRRFISNAYGFGVAVVEDPARTASLSSAGRHGWGGAAGTFYWVDPKEELVAILMIQRMMIGDRTAISEDFDAMIYQALR